MDINFFVVSDFESAPFIADGWDEHTSDSNWEGYREAYTKLMGECLSEGSEMRVASVTLDDAVIDSLKDTPQVVNDHVGSSSERLVYLVIAYPTCSYPGEYAPYIADVWDEYTREMNEEGYLESIANLSGQDVVRTMTLALGTDGLNALFGVPKLAARTV